MFRDVNVTEGVSISAEVPPIRNLTVPYGEHVIIAWLCLGKNSSLN